MIKKSITRTHTTQMYITNRNILILYSISLITIIFQILYYHKKKTNNVNPSV